MLVGLLFLDGLPRAAFAGSGAGVVLLGARLVLLVDLNAPLLTSALVVVAGVEGLCICAEAVGLGVAVSGVGLGVVVAEGVGLGLAVAAEEKDLGCVAGGGVA